ncbi:MAG: hypothetical protein ACTSX9_05305 [Candidatus Njordarchaeales archaeon]
MKSSHARIKIDKQRLDFVRYWVKYIKTHPSKDWSLQQKNLIDSIILNADQDIEKYLRVKRIAREIAKKLKTRSHTQ